MNSRRAFLGRMGVIAVALVLMVGLVACNKSAPTLAPGGASQASVSISNFAFNPESITVKAGTTVIWTNHDSAAHTVTADDGSWSGSVPQNASFSHKFSTPGTYKYHCAIHVQMLGTVNVTAN